MKMIAIVLFFLVSLPSSRAEVLIDGKSQELFDKSVRKLELSLNPDKRKNLRLILNTVQNSYLCPIRDKVGDSITRSILLDELRLKLNGYSFDDLARVNKKIKQNSNINRTIIEKSSTEFSLIEKRVKEYLSELEDINDYMQLKSYWTTERVHYATKNRNYFDSIPQKEALWPGAPSGMNGNANDLQMLNNKAIRKAINYKTAKLYRVELLGENTIHAFVTFQNRTEKTIKLILKKENKNWLLHADIAGFPWNAEGSEVPNCTEYRL